MTDALAGLSPERAREIVETVTYWLDNPPISGSDREHLYSSVRAMIPLAERGLATLGATEAFAVVMKSGSEGEFYATEGEARTIRDEQFADESLRRVLILREGA